VRARGLGPTACPSRRRRRQRRDGARSDRRRPARRHGGCVSGATPGDRCRPPGRRGLPRTGPGSHLGRRPHRCQILGTADRVKVERHTCRTTLTRAAGPSWTMAAGRVMPLPQPARRPGPPRPSRAHCPAARRPPSCRHRSSTVRGGPHTACPLFTGPPHEAARAARQGRLDP
jgi:hypothetical protein